MLWPQDVMREMDRMRRDMESLFSLTPLYNRGTYQYPLVNLYDSKEELILIAEIPGTDKNSINIQFNSGNLTLSGKRELKTFGKSEMLRQEQPEGSFEKTIRVPVKIKESDIKAKFENGLLCVTLPKAEEAKPHQITIQT
jgi:HSP20 family protein